MRAMNVRTASAALACALMTLPACEAEIYDNGGIVEVAAEPPPPQVEVVPPMPYAGAVWIPGVWEWQGGRHVWVRGRYVRPRAGYYYQPHRWERTPSGGWRHTPGGWRRR
jgi:hypothetical protein